MRRIALVSQTEIDACIGSSSFSVCTNGFSLETAEDTCSGALLFGNQFTELQNCDVNSVKLPVKELRKRKVADNVSVGSKQYVHE